MEEIIECTECDIQLEYKELIDGNYCPRCRCGWYLTAYIW